MKSFKKVFAVLINAIFPQKVGYRIATEQKKFCLYIVLCISILQLQNYFFCNILHFSRHVLKMSYCTIGKEGHTKKLNKSRSESPKNILYWNLACVQC